MRTALIASLLFCSSPALANTVYYVDIVNPTASDWVSIEVAPAGSERFHSVPIVRDLSGSGAKVTLAIRKGDAGCRRDVRLGFADGHSLTRRNLDLCRFPS